MDPNNDYMFASVLRHNELLAAQRLQRVRAAVDLTAAGAHHLQVLQEAAHDSESDWLSSRTNELHRSAVRTLNTLHDIPDTARAWNDPHGVSIARVQESLFLEGLKRTGLTSINDLREDGFDVLAMALACFQTMSRTLRDMSVVGMQNDRIDAFDAVCDQAGAICNTIADIIMYTTDNAIVVPAPKQEPDTEQEHAGVDERVAALLRRRDKIVALKHLDTFWDDLTF